MVALMRKMMCFCVFFASCKVNNVNPYLWLNDVLQRIPEHKANKLAELLPDNWENPNL